jgi:hypothetical protein
MADMSVPQGLDPAAAGGSVNWVGPGNNGFDLYRLDLREG